VKLRSHRTTGYRAAGESRRRRAPRPRTRLVTLAAATALSATGLTATGAAPAFATAGDTMAYMTDLNGQLTIVDTATGARTTAQVGGSPNSAILVSPSGSLAYFVSSEFGTVESVNTLTDTEVASVAAPCTLGAGALDAASGTVYVACGYESPSSIQVVDVNNLNDYQITASIPIAAPPSQLVPDPASGTLYVVTDGLIEAVSMTDNTVVDANLDLPAGSLSLSPNGQYLYDAYGDSIYVVDTATEGLAGWIDVPRGAGATAICSNGETMYTSGAVISVISLSGANGTVVGTLPETGSPLYLNPACTTLYDISGTINAINTTTGAVISYPGLSDAMSAFGFGPQAPTIWRVPTW
jgi:hypothetical protein